MDSTPIYTELQQTLADPEANDWEPSAPPEFAAALTAQAERKKTQNRSGQQASQQNDQQPESRQQTGSQHAQTENAQARESQAKDAQHQGVQRQRNQHSGGAARGEHKHAGQRGPSHEATSQNHSGSERATRSGGRRRRAED